jgi:6-phosphogluconolactonase
MMKTSLTSRREFLQRAAATSMLPAASMLTAASPIRSCCASGSPLPSSGSRFAYIGSASSLHLFSIRGRQWTHAQQIDCEAPVSLVAHPTLPLLYALNEVSRFQNLPCGSITAYRIDPHSGELNLCHRQALSLSAIMPRQIAIHPDGKSIAVAISGGGSYNLLPVSGHGTLGRPVSILKATGRGPIADLQESSHPQSLLFDPTSKRLITADLGNDKINVLSATDGLQFLKQHPASPGSGPKHLAMHPSSNWIYAASSLDDSLAIYPYEPISGRLSRPTGILHGGFQDALVIHPCGKYLYAAGNGHITAWGIHQGQSGSSHLERLQLLANDAPSVSAMSLSSNRQQLGIAASSGVSTLEINATTGHLGQQQVVADLQNPRCLLLA